MNFCLGKDYNFVDKETNPEEFNEMKKHYTWGDEIYAFISYQDGAKIQPLSSKQAAFVMTENGATFANVSQR